MPHPLKRALLALALSSCALPALAQTFPGTAAGADGVTKQVQPTACVFGCSSIGSQTSPDITGGTTGKPYTQDATTNDQKIILDSSSDLGKASDPAATIGNLGSAPLIDSVKLGDNLLSQVAQQSVNYALLSNVSSPGNGTAAVQAAIAETAMVDLLGTGSVTINTIRADGSTIASYGPYTAPLAFGSTYISIPQGAYLRASVASSPAPSGLYLNLWGISGSPPATSNSAQAYTLLSSASNGTGAAQAGASGGSYQFNLAGTFSGATVVLHQVINGVDTVLGSYTAAPTTAPSFTIGQGTSLYAVVSGGTSPSITASLNGVGSGGGSGGGGGAITAADNAIVSFGHIADAACPATDTTAEGLICLTKQTNLAIANLTSAIATAYGNAVDPAAGTDFNAATTFDMNMGFKSAASGGTNQPVTPTSGLPIAAQGVTSTDASGTVTTASTFQTLQAANSSRKGCIVQNTSVAAETLKLNTTNFTLAAGATFSCSAGLNVVQDALAITSATAGSAFSAAFQ